MTQVARPAAVVYRIPGQRPLWSEQQPRRGRRATAARKPTAVSVKPKPLLSGACDTLDRSQPVLAGPKLAPALAVRQNRQPRGCPVDHRHSGRAVVRDLARLLQGASCKSRTRLYRTRCRSRIPATEQRSSDASAGVVQGTRRSFLSTGRAPLAESKHPHRSRGRSQADQQPDASETNTAVGEMELAEAVVKDLLRLRSGCTVPNLQPTADGASGSGRRRSMASMSA